MEDQGHCLLAPAKYIRSSSEKILTGTIGSHDNAAATAVVCFVCYIRHWVNGLLLPAAELNGGISLSFYSKMGNTDPLL